MRSSFASSLVLALAGCSSSSSPGAPADAPHATGSDARPIDAPGDAPIAPGSDARPPADGHAPPDGSVPGGSELRFAVVGDTRPLLPNDTANYPTAIITKIWQDIQGESPRPAFAVATGDYMFATTGSSVQQAQLDVYMQARAAFSGPLYAAYGNHECTSATASNCGPGTADGVTKNYSAFMATMLPPGETLPYYTEHVTAPDGSWTAKVVVMACNAWTPAQASWLNTALAEPTTYTFVVRHEGADATSAPCMAQATASIAAHPLTLLVVGHTHTYRHDPATKQLMVGIGGAPLTTGANYGYAIVARNADGTITSTAYDYQSHAVMDTFTVKADGSPN